MKINDKDRDLIERYLEGSLKPDAVRAFDERLRRDKEFKNAFEEFKHLRAAIMLEGQRQLKSKISIWESEAPETRRFMVLPVATLKWAAGFLLLLSVVYSIYHLSNRQPEVSTGNSFEFTPYPNILTDRKGSQSTYLDTLLNYYANEQYDQFVGAYKKQRDEPRDAYDEYAEFYYAESLMELGAYEEALHSFSLFTNKEHAFYEISRLHSALALAGIGRTDSAINLLTIISIEKGPYQEQASLILNRLQHEGHDLGP